MNLIPWKELQVTVLRRSVIGQVYKHVQDQRESLRLLHKFRTDVSDVSVWPLHATIRRTILARDVDWTGFPVAV